MTKRAAKPYRAKRETARPCAICGWSFYMGIHLPALTGPREGQPFGHAYVPAASIRSHLKEDGQHE